MLSKRLSVSRIAVLITAGILALLFVGLRARWVGHLLTWDETMTLCTVRAFVTESRDTFANWFWRHPPLFCLAMTQLRPLAPGFAERVEWLGIGIGLLNAALLYGLNRQALGRAVAAWSVFFLALQPAAAFYGVWIKGDHLVVTFGLAALILSARGRTLYAGLALGLALLSKETAVFFVAAAVLLHWRRGVREVVALLVPAALASGWWYLWFSTDSHTAFAAGADAGWRYGWDFYLAALPRYLSYGALALALAAVVISARIWRLAPAPAPAPTLLPVWPLLLLVPAYALLSALSGKAAWAVAACMPAWATLSALGLTTCVRACARHAGPAAAGAVAAGVAGWLGLHAAGLDYDALLREVCPDQWRGAHYSYEIAETANRHVSADDRLLLTSFHHWQGIPPGHPCPVFAYYFKQRCPVLIRPHDRPFAAYARDILDYRLTRAILSPAPGPQEFDVFDGFIGRHGLEPIRMQRAFLFDTSPMLRPPP